LTATLIAFVAIVIILIVMLRRVADVVLILIPLALAAALTSALSFAFGLSFNFANIIVLPLLLGLGIASAIHLVVRWRHSDGSLEMIASSTPRAVFFSAMTTIAAFGSLAVSGHLGMRSMGILLAIALASTLIATLIVLPSLMAVLGTKRRIEP
jgi:predicted RND superfamily exporter protein